mmetsp:Transcript_19890/g.41324  ORF Transcript_19890/g.41324 Transcript_19890/m.41324 type:complete len:553 (-) Transcript_19890:71-1729(-)
MSSLSAPPAALRRQSSHDLDGPDLLELCSQIPLSASSVPSSSLPSSNTASKTFPAPPSPVPSLDSPGAANGEGVVAGPDDVCSAPSSSSGADPGPSAPSAAGNPPPFLEGWGAVLSRAKSLDDRSLRAELFMADGTGMSVIMFCLCFNGPVEIVELALCKCRTKAPRHTNEAGDHILKMRSSAGWLPLHLAAGCCLEVNIFRLLIRHYPEALVEECPQGTPMVIAKEMGKGRSTNAEIVRLLEDCTAAYKARDAATLLKHCVIVDLLSLTKAMDWQACMDRVKWSLVNPAHRFLDEILKMDNFGWTALHHAIKWQGPSDLISLIIHKCDTSANRKRLLSLMDNSGYQALHLAAGHYEDVSVIRSFIVEYPAALHVKSDSGKTPLQYAQSTGTQRPTHPEIVSLIDCCTCANNEYEIKKLCGAIDPTYAHLRDQLEEAMKARDCDRIDESIALMESIRLGTDDLVVQARALAEELRPLQVMSKLERQLSDRNRKLDEATEKLDATICVVCMQEQRSCVIMPCAHLVTCTSCSDRLTSCPICRGEIERKINTHG